MITPFLECNIYRNWNPFFLIAGLICLLSCQEKTIVPTCEEESIPNGLSIIKSSYGEIYQMEQNGKNKRNLTQNKADDRSANWSPDGSKIIFLSDRDQGNDLFIMDADGRNTRKLASKVANHTNLDLAWSPDGSKIAFSARGQTDIFAIYTINADGSDLSLLTSGTTDNLSPSWSPDGSKIAFVQGTTQAYIINSDGSNLKKLSNTRLANFTLRWSPDGSKIAFSGDDHIFVVEVKDTHQIQISTGQTYDYNPSWSPDGSQIAYSVGQLGRSDIYISNADGTNPIQLTKDYPSANNPIWSPDGNRIAFEVLTVNDTKTTIDIYSMNRDGSSQTSLTNHPDDEINAKWSSDSQKIIYTLALSCANNTSK